jgi:hypothetical protein
MPITTNTALGKPFPLSEPIHMILVSYMEESEANARCVAEFLAMRSVPERLECADARHFVPFIFRHKHLDINDITVVDGVVRDVILFAVTRKP